MSTPSLNTRYAPMDAQWLLFWGHRPEQQVVASLAFAVGLVATLSMGFVTVDISTQMAWVGVMAGLLHHLTRSACSQLTQAQVVLRLAPAPASHLVWRRWHTHLWAVSLSLGGLHWALLLWRSNGMVLPLWAAMVLLGAIALAAWQAAGRSGHWLWPVYLLGAVLSGLPMLELSTAPWITALISAGSAVLTATFALTLRHSAQQLRLRPLDAANARSPAPPWHARWRAWWQRWTFLAQASAQRNMLAHMGGAAGAVPALMLLDWLPKPDTPLQWKHLCMLFWTALFLKDLVVCRDLHWRTWLAPKSLTRRRLGWRVWRDTLTLVAVFIGLPALIWLGVSVHLGHKLNWTAITTATVMVLLATTVAVWVVGRHLQSPHRTALEIVILALLAGMGWLAQTRLGLPGQLDLLTQALPLAAAVMAVALWRIDRVWQRADVYALAHRRPEPTGWEID